MSEYSTQWTVDTTPFSFQEHYGKGVALRKKTFCQVWKDVLVQVLQLSSLEVDGSVKSAMLLREPLAVDVWEALPLLSHVVCDRGVPENVVHYLSGRWLGNSLVSSVQSHDLKPGDTALDINDDVVRAFEWHVATGCVAHDIHNSLRWSLASSFDDEEPLRKTHILTQAGRASFASVLYGLASCLDALIHPVEASNLPFESELRGHWTSLQVEEDLMRELLHFNF
eukprot:3808612-Amphidinium_carterae.3